MFNNNNQTAPLSASDLNAGKDSPFKKVDTREILKEHSQDPNNAHSPTALDDKKLSGLKSPVEDVLAGTDDNLKLPEIDAAQSKSPSLNDELVLQKISSVPTMEKPVKKNKISHVTPTANILNTPPPIAPTPKKPKKSKLFPIIVIVLVVIILGIGGYFAYSYFIKKDQLVQQNSDDSLQELLDQLSQPDDTENTQNTESTQNTQDWQTYTNLGYGFQFEYPKKYVTEEHYGTIYVAKDKLEFTDIGGDNSFFTIRPLDEYSRKDFEVESSLLSDKTEDSTTLAGQTVVKISGTDYGRLEGMSAGKIILIKLDNKKIFLRFVEKPQGINLDFDAESIFNQILSTFKFIDTPQQPSIMDLDSDSDGLTDQEEMNLGTNPNKFDSDGDGLSDFEELEIYKSDPIRADTDGDGYSDGDEVVNGYDPLRNGAKLGE